MATSCVPQARCAVARCKCDCTITAMHECEWLNEKSGESKGERKTETVRVCVTETETKRAHASAEWLSNDSVERQMNAIK
jgi:hypothetical protein